MPRLDLLLGNIDHTIQLEMRLLIADTLDLIAESQFEKEPDALYSGVEVSIALRDYAQAIRERGK